MFLYPLCSSSKGNATYIGDKEKGILIDTGLSCRRLSALLAAADVPLHAIRAIFITHEHSDHVSGLSGISAKLQIPVYAAGPTLQYLLDQGLVAETLAREWCPGAGKEAGFQVTPFRTSHDSRYSQGYRVDTPSGSVALCTDLGVVTESVYDKLKGCSAVLLESNYDPDMLSEGHYPLFLQKRIASGRGHLSNSQCAETLIRLYRDGVRHFVLGHLSENNNTPMLAQQCAMRALLEEGAVLNRDYTLRIAGSQRLGQTVPIEGGEQLAENTASLCR